MPFMNYLNIYKLNVTLFVRDGLRNYLADFNLHTVYSLIQLERQDSLHLNLYRNIFLLQIIFLKGYTCILSS